LAGPVAFAINKFWGGFLKKTQCRAGFGILPQRIALCHYRTEILRFRELPFSDALPEQYRA
jgi:hypothetical protein